MAWMDTCSGCKGWKSGHARLCSECSGENSRHSYDNRTGMLAENLYVAAMEELRVRAATGRICAAMLEALLKKVAITLAENPAQKEQP